MTLIVFNPTKSHSGVEDCVVIFSNVLFITVKEMKIKAIKKVKYFFFEKPKRGLNLELKCSFVVYFM